MAGYTPYYAPYNYPIYQPPRFDQQQYMPQNGAQNAVGAPQGQGAMTTSPAIQTGFLCRPVTSREEAVAVQVDYLSAGTIMPDLGHGMMYLKRFDSNTGLSNMFEFALVQPQSGESQQEQERPVIPDYTETFRTFSEQLISVSEKIDTMTDKLEMWKPKPSSRKGAGEE